jgi:hypothetical protein
LYLEKTCMKNKRSTDYFARKKANPISDKEDIAKNPDNKIDQDFPGYPNGQAKKETIKPNTGTQKKMAGLNQKDGEKKDRKEYKNKAETDEQDSDGSANAFDDK